MGLDTFSDDVRDFLLSKIDSIELLNVLLLLHSDPDKTWTSEEITRELRSTPGSIELRLTDLYQRKVIVHVPELGNRHRFNPPDQSLRQVIDQLAEFYRLRPYTVIELIYSQPSRSLKAFGDAFNLKGEKEK